ncbi:hypothetical protein [Salinisphaera sp. Q1T1-3]|uniref:hypothetical protein n=1 Tax=Salinisphaera sp. Q1T1-3 TaxID=2321229 RepID=UPI000E70E733|nr:hypothetical protein [Salinisphaera sp. Q1T1-3]RJS94767.1 hypothetical protein D3260_03080 [Salinisphaera sp. Q1T1-3]
MHWATNRNHARRRTVITLGIGLALAGPVGAQTAIPMPVVDGAGAQSQATGPNGTMSGNLYVPERQSTHPRALQALPRQLHHLPDGHHSYSPGHRRHGGWHDHSALPDRQRDRRLDHGAVNPNRQQLERAFGD